MSLIRKSTELNIPTNVKMMIYGQAGMGKSTVALSAPKPLLLDFDNGVKRMNMAHLENIDTVQVTSWNDVQLVLQEDLSVWVPGCVPDYFWQPSGASRRTWSVLHSAGNALRVQGFRVRYGNAHPEDPSHGRRG